MVKKIISNKIFTVILFYFTLLILVSALCFNDPNIDVDFWSRLIMGHHVFHSGSVMKQDIISYAPTHVWYDHEWLLSYFLFVFVKYFGVAGIFFIKILFSFLTIVFIDLISVKKSGCFEYKYKYFYITLLVALMFHTKVFTTLRCQNFSQMILPVMILILETYRNNPKTKIIYLIPFLFLVWLNCHGGCMYGMGILGLYIFGQILNRKESTKLFVIFIISMFAFIINPWGIDFIKFMISAISVDRSYIAEWQSPFTMSAEVLIPFILIQLTILSVFIYSSIRQKLNFRTLDYVKILVFSAVFLIGLKYIKYAISYFMVVFMFLYDDFKTVCDDIVNLFKKIIKDSVPSIKYCVLLFYIVISTMLFVTNDYDLCYKNTIKELPLYPLQMLIDNNIKGNIFMSFFTSGYTAYKFYPDFKIYMDGRQEQVYDFSVVQKEMAFLGNPMKYAYAFLNEYKPDIILVENFFPVKYFLDTKQDYYKKVYQDNMFAMYLAPSKQLAEYKYPQRVPEFSQRNFIKSKCFN